MLMAEDPQHDIQAPVNPVHRVGLGIVSGGKRQPDACLLEGLLHQLGPEENGIIRVNLQQMTKPGI